MFNIIRSIIVAVALTGTVSMARAVRVSGYAKRNGQYVHAHLRTSPDQTKRNNWSTKGNVNPYTGKFGSK
jgi:hypothetical protein